MNQELSDDSAGSAAIRLILEPYHQRIYDLEGRLRHVGQAYIHSDRLRMECQLKLETLTKAAERVQNARGRFHTQIAFEALIKLLQEQKKTTQP